MPAAAQEGLVVCHRVPGRLRIKITSVRNAKDPSIHLENLLKQIDGVKQAEARSSTGSIILFYDKDRINASQIMQQIAETLKKRPKDFSDDDGGACVRDLAANSKFPPSSPILYYLLNAVVLGGFLVYSVLRSVLIKSPLSQRPFSITGIVASVGALPLLFRAWDDLRQKRTKGLFPFLAAGCGLAILAGEALTALEIIWVLAVGMLLEEYVTDRARRAIRQILQVRPQKTFVLIKGVEVEIPVNELVQGDTVVVRTGQKIPTDGIVLKGEALVDEAHITGRSLPELRRSDDWVYAGTRVQ
jgi:cation-transporting P-type ATPase C